MKSLSNALAVHDSEKKNPGKMSSDQVREFHSRMQKKRKAKKGKGTKPNPYSKGLGSPNWGKEKE